VERKSYMARERSPDSTRKIAVKVGGDGDEKSVAITQMVKTVRSKANLLLS
jgi:hypothetical protein